MHMSCAHAYAHVHAHAQAHVHVGVRRHVHAHAHVHGHAHVDMWTCREGGAVENYTPMHEVQKVGSSKAPVGRPASECLCNRPLSLLVEVVE